MQSSCMRDFFHWALGVSSPEWCWEVIGDCLLRRAFSGEGLDPHRVSCVSLGWCFGAGRLGAAGVVVAGGLVGCGMIQGPAVVEESGLVLARFDCLRWG